jgi:uncharacterized protein
MKFLLEPDMKQIKISITALFVLLFIPLIANGQTDVVPVRPSPARLVNDFTGFLTPAEQQRLERKLDKFDDSTSIQIAVVIVKSLEGYDVSDMGTRILQKWGVGHKEKNNGIVVLIKPKTNDEKGKIAISTGYGAESLVTDALSKRIIEQEIFPSFSNGQYYQGLDKATNTLYSFLRGEFSPSQYMAKGKAHKGSRFPVTIIIFLVIIVISFFSRRSSNGTRQFSSGGGTPFWMMGGGNSSGSYGNFSSGDGGFGGFGGGTGGGGGASGSW